MPLSIARSIFETVGNAASPRTLTYGSTTTTGKQLAIAINNNGGGASDLDMPPDSKGNDFSLIASALGSVLRTRINAWQTNEGNFGSSHQVSVNNDNPGADALHWGVIEFAGAASVLVDTVSSNVNTGLCSGTDAFCSTAGTLANGEVILVAAAGTRGEFGDVNLNTPVGWTNLSLQNTPVGGIGSSFCYKSMTVAGNAQQTVQFTHNGTDSEVDWVCGLMVVRPAALSNVLLRLRRMGILS